MNKLELLNFINRQKDKKENIVLLAKREDIIFPLPIGFDNLEIVKKHIQDEYDANLLRKDEMYRLIDAENEEDFCKNETEKKIREMLNYFKTMSLTCAKL